MISQQQQSYTTHCGKYASVTSEPTPTVAAIGELEFIGNLTPHSWYSHLKLPSGHTDLVGITLLGEIVYQYRPGMVRDEETGQPIHTFKRFVRDQFCAPIAYFCKKFGLTPDQVRQGLKRLEEGGYIHREYRDILVAGRWVRGMTFIEPIPERIRAITPPPRPDARPAPGAVQRPRARQDSVASPESAGSAREGAVSPPGGTVQIPPYTNTSEIPKRTTTTPPSPPSSRDTGSSSRSHRQQTPENTPTPVPSQAVPATITATEVDTPPPSSAMSMIPPPTETPTTIADYPTRTAESPAAPPLLFDFHLTALDTAQQAELCRRLARLPSPLAQAVLDEYNSAIGRNVQFRNKWGWFEFLIRAALDGRFIPTSDLAERRAAQSQAQVQTAAANSSASTPPARQPSAVWEAHQEELVRLLPPSEVGINLSPLRALEDEHTLWLEAPNTFVANWVRAHLPQIETVMKLYTVLPIRVCIG